MERLERIGPTFGQQFNPYVIQKDEKTFVFYTSNHDEGDSYLWKTTLEPFEKPKTEKVGKDRIFGFNIVKSKDKYYLGAGGDIYTLDPSGEKLDKIEINHTFQKTPFIIMLDRFFDHRLYYLYFF